PRSKPTAKPNNKLSDLAAKLSHLQNDINKLERTRAKPKCNVHYPGRHSQLIPKPKGQAGRSPPKGYQIQEAMGLACNSGCIMHFGCMCHFIQKTHDLDAPQLQAKYTYLSRFQNTWPMRDMIGQYLRNQNAYAKHRPILQTT
ncbi:hypothetical protein P692DRAFT_20666790, partial [Suillus brevipes Sb2]